MQIQPITKQLGEFFDVPNGKGVLVAEVKKGSSAEKAGFKAGDVITKIDNNVVRDIEDLREELSDNREKGTPFEVMRKGKSLTLTMKLEEEDEEDDDDDYSNNIIIPHERHHLNMFRMELPHIDHMELNHLKEDMKEFGKRLKDKIQHLKETLREELREL